MKPTFITLRKEDADLNMRRQYSISVERDLFGTPLVVCRWGRIGKAGQCREHLCSNTEEARALAARLVRRRRVRGYRSAKMLRSSARQAATVTTTPWEGGGGKRWRRRCVPAEQLHLWSIRAVEQRPAQIQDVVKQPSGWENSAVGHERLRQATIDRILSESAARATAHGEALKLHRSSLSPSPAAAPSSALKWCDLREELIEEAINVPSRGWRKPYRRYVR